jgi:hypothetical protein
MGGKMFHFDKNIDPPAPITKSDPPPESWELVDAHDYGKALFGFATQLFIDCVEWEKRELNRNLTIQKVKE